MISRTAQPLVIGSLVLAAALAVAAGSSACAPAPAGHEGTCTPADPSARASGVVATDVNDLPLDDGGSASVSFSHKRDVDPVEDGCVGAVDVRLVANGTCSIALAFAATGDALTLERGTFTADSDCPGWLDEQEGDFKADAHAGVTVTAPSALPAENVDEFCLPFELALAGEVSFYEIDPFTFAPEEDGRTLTMTLDGVTVSGMAESFGRESLRCVE